jgi:rubredoxin---NAD+ reductase
MKPVIIIGAGLAGYTLAREVRKLDKDMSLLIVSADAAGFYSKPMLSNAFAQRKQAAQLVTHSAAQMAAQLDARVVGDTVVHVIDPAQKVIVTSVGRFEYAALVLATGARPIRLPFEGNAAGEVLSVNHVDDYALFRRKMADTGKAAVRVAIIGAGLIGCEFANDLADAGHKVSLIDPNPLPLAALATPALSQGLQAALAQRGIDLRLGTTASQINRASHGLHLTLANGSICEADIVLSAVGLRPDISLAQQAHLRTNRGIVVDGFGQTSAAGVYALGDCAEYCSDTDGSSRTLPYVAPLMTAARAIARTLTGQPTRIELQPAAVIVKTPCYPLALLPPPVHAVAEGQWQHVTEGNRTISRFIDAAGVMLGFGVAPQEAAVRQGLLAELGKQLA